MKIAFLVFVVFFVSGHAHANGCRNLSTDFSDDRIYLKVQTKNGLVSLYTDSGGGIFPFVYEETAQKLGMTIERTINEYGFSFGLSSFPSFLQQFGIPQRDQWNGHVRVFKYFDGGKDEPSQLKFILGDGFLGATFFADRTWHFNYPSKILSVCASLPEVSSWKKTAMFFREGDNGIRTTHQPRIEVEVDGVKIPVLFDTGATSFYSAEAMQILLPPKQFSASSFIKESVALSWLARHPEWRVIKRGDRFGGDLVEVPSIKIAGVTVGPVWFATRQDKIYDQYSEQIMDSRIDGAVGGNVFRTLEMVADYPGSLLYLRAVN